MTIKPPILPEGLLALERPDLIRTQAFIDGRWVDASSTFEVFDPASGALIAQVADSDADMARRAVEAATTAFAEWRTTTPKHRAGVLRRWFDAILRHQEDLAKIISWEMGKPLAEARGEIAYGAAYFEWFADLIRQSPGEVLPSPVPGRQMLALREPVGVTAVITPWNFPSAMIARKIAPALAAGCTVVGKPAEDTPLSALALAVLAEEAEVPAGVLNLVPASRAQTPIISDVWLSDARVRKLSFTGSTPVGRILARDATNTLKRVSMELGGDAPFLVFADADLNLAVDALLKAKFRNAGQACIAANRVLVQREVQAPFTSKLVAAVEALRPGAAADGHADTGPLINARALEKVERLVADAREKGAQILIGGHRISGPGFFFQPTVLTDVSSDMTLACEEIFGPVVALQVFDTEDDAVRIANDTPYGLAAYVCTSDQKRTWRLAAALECGMVGINEGAISSEVAPFGGVKQSGYGREGSAHGLEDYQSIKYVCIGGLS
ncbi:Glutarate-semialdehyde dehydrogenase DavD [compost metagenome]